MKYVPFFIVLWCSVAICPTQESFLAEQPLDRKNKEKKYSELYDELLESYKLLLLRYSQMIRDITHAQELCIEEIERLAQNMPKAPRKRLIRDLERVAELKKSSENCIFF